MLKDGERCSKPALRGEIFCWSHVFRGHGWLFPLALAAVSILVGVLISYHFARGASDELASAMHVSRDRYIPRVAGLPAQVHAGIQFSINRPNVTFKPSAQSPFGYSINDGKDVLVTGALHDTTGRVVAELRDSRLWIPVGSEYDINSDDRLLEVVRPDGSPILQIGCSKDGRTLHVDYVAYIHNADGSLRLEQAFDRIFASAPVKPDDPVARLPWPASFKYPGHRHPGERAR